MGKILMREASMFVWLVLVLHFKFQRQNFFKEERMWNSIEKDGQKGLFPLFNEGQILVYHFLEKKKIKKIKAPNWGGMHGGGLTTPTHLLLPLRLLLPDLILSPSVLGSSFKPHLKPPWSHTEHAAETRSYRGVVWGEPRVKTRCRPLRWKPRAEEE